MQLFDIPESEGQIEIDQMFMIDHLDKVGEARTHMNER